MSYSSRHSSNSFLSGPGAGVGAGMGCFLLIVLFLLIFAVESLLIGLAVWGAWNLILVAIVPTVAAITYGTAWLYGLILAVISSLFTVRVNRS